MGANLPLCSKGLQGLSLKGLASGDCKMARSDFRAQSGCMREDINALGSSAQDVNVKKCTHFAPSQKDIEI